VTAETLPRETRHAETLLVEDLRVYYHTPRGAVRAVDGVSFALKPDERLGFVGESGSGKTTIAMALIRLIKPPGKIEGGHIYLGETDLLSLSDEQMRQLRLADIAMVTQGAMNSLNPVKRVREQVIDALEDHGVRITRQEMDERITELFRRVGLRPEVANMFPHELSGGMKQRVVIAIAISMRPKVIIADEPTSALDVVVQRQIMETLRQVQDDLGASVILIGHDMGLMAQFVTRLGVMYAGKLAEIGSVGELFEQPLHPYTQLLIASLPSLEQKGGLQGIPGVTPSLLDKPSGCPFRTRCPRAFDRCSAEEPALREIQPDHWVACHLY